MKKLATKLPMAALALVFCAQSWAGVQFKENFIKYEAAIGERFIVDLRTLVEGAKGDMEFSVAGTGVPEWLTFDKSLEMMFGVPEKADIGVSTFKIAVRDGDAGALATVEISVPAPKPEHITFKKPTIKERIVIGTENAFVLANMIDGVKPEKGNVLWALSSDAPAFVELTEDALTANPLEADAGTHQFQIFASQGGVGASATFVLEVANKLENRPPIWTAKAIHLGDVCKSQGLKVDLNQFVTDPDGDKVIFSNVTDSMPQVTVSESGMLSIFTIPTTWAGGYQVDILASDGELGSQGRLYFNVKHCVN